MRRIIHSSRALLGALDPEEHDVCTTAEVIARSERDLSDILSDSSTTKVTNHRAKSRWAIPSAIAVATSVALIAVVVTGIFPFNSNGTSRAFAATPPLLEYGDESGSAEQILTTLADRVEQLPAEPGGYQHIVTEGWALNSRIQGELVTSVVLPSQHEIWIAPDGSVRLRARYGEPESASEEQRAAWEDQADDIDLSEETTDYPAGAYPRMWADAGPPPREPDKFRTWLQYAHPAENGPVEIFVAWRDLLGETVPGPVVRANLLRTAATLPGIVYRGRTVDRAGRDGLAFSLESDSHGLPTRYTMIVDPDTGALLSSEEMLTTTAGKLNVPVPSVISYTTYLVEERTSSGPPS